MQPIRKRAHETRALVLEAARHVLADVGRDHLTTTMVAERAGVSIGTVYRYWEDRVALLGDLGPSPDARIAIAQGFLLQTLANVDSKHPWSDNDQREVLLTTMALLETGEVLSVSEVVAAPH